MTVEPVTLDGSLVRLEPLSLDHVGGLCAAGLHPGVFRWYSDPVDSPDRMREWVATALRARGNGDQLPFATIERASGHVVGSTRFMNIDPVEHRLEIGATWLRPDRHGGGHNTEAKLLQLSHAFDVLGCIRVEFKTDSLNERSRGALTAIGALFEGVFRDHMIRHDGTHRHSAYYSIVAAEWPRVRAGLEGRLARQTAGAGGIAGRVLTVG